MMDHIVIDIETAKTIDEVSGGWAATDQLGISCACLWEYSGARMRVYGPEDIAALRQRVLQADRITGFNIREFDLSVIFAVSKTAWLAPHGASPDVSGLQSAIFPKINDLLRRIWLSSGLNPNQYDKATHGGLGLDKVALATLGVGKLAHGGDAPKWYQAGEWAKLVNYCADDVALERDLSDFIDRYGFIVDPRTTRKLKIFASSEGK